MDRVGSGTRSRIMSVVKSRGGRTTERRLRAYMVARGITGWRANLKNLPGSPDFAFPERKMAVFVDGCFWHDCHRCCRRPKSRVKFWNEKFASNRARDRRQARQLRALGWEVLRVWEHAVLKTPATCVERIASLLAACHRKPDDSVGGS